jgi:hypothetical protein
MQYNKGMSGLEALLQPTTTPVGTWLKAHVNGLCIDGGTAGQVWTNQDGKGTGAWANSGGGGGVTSVSAANGTVSVTPTTGAVTVAATGEFGSTAISTTGIVSTGNLRNTGMFSSDFKGGNYLITSDGGGKLNVGEIIPAAGIEAGGTTSLDNGGITTDGNGNLTAASFISPMFSIGPASIVLQSVTLSITPAQIYALTTTALSNSITIIPAVAGKCARVITATVTGGGVVFTGGAAPVLGLGAVSSAGAVLATGTITILPNMWTNTVADMVFITTTAGTNSVPISLAYGSTYGLVLTSGTTYSGGGANTVFNCLYYYTT